MTKDNVTVNVRNPMWAFWFIGGLFTLGLLVTTQPGTFPEDSWHAALFSIGILATWPFLLGVMVGELLKLTALLGLVSLW